MNATERLKNHQSRVLDKLIQAPDDEEVVKDDGLALVQLHPRPLKVKVDVQVFQELRDRVFVRVGLLLNHLDQVFEGVTTTPINDDSCR